MPFPPHLFHHIFPTILIVIPKLPGAASPRTGTEETAPLRCRLKIDAGSGRAGNDLTLAGSRWAVTFSPKRGGAVSSAPVRGEAAPGNFGMTISMVRKDVVEKEVVAKDVVGKG